jgi:phage anti-repressor protein
LWVKPKPKLITILTVVGFFIYFVIMNELIKVSSNEKGKQVVSARDLHIFLEVPTRFDVWIIRMFEYGFEAGKDYTEVTIKNDPNSKGGRSTLIDYALTLNTAKEIAMIQRTAKGKQAREYFIKCETELLALQVERKKEDPFWYMKRYNANNDKVPAGHFSMLAEVMVIVVEPLVVAGAKETMFDNLFIDISMGKLFCQWLRKHNLMPDKLPKYKHTTPKGRVVEANLYPFKLMGDFRTFLQNEWVLNSANKYFSERNPDLLPYLPKLIEKAKQKLK